LRRRSDVRPSKRARLLVRCTLELSRTLHLTNALVVPRSTAVSSTLLTTQHLPGHAKMALRQLCVTLARRAGSSGQQQLLPAALTATSSAAAAASAAAAPAAAAAAPALRMAAAAFSTSGSALSESLQSLLQREVKHEKTTYEQPEALAKGPPAPFTLTSVPGDSTVTLKRTYNGEEIAVDASVNMQVRADGSAG